MVIVLLTVTGAARLPPGKMVVRTSEAAGRAGDEDWTRTVTVLDLNGDSRPEIAHVVRRSRNRLLCTAGEYGCSSREAYVALRWNNAWLKSSEIVDGQDGPEGF